MQLGVLSKANPRMMPIIEYYDCRWITYWPTGIKLSPKNANFKHQNRIEKYFFALKPSPKPFYWFCTKATIYYCFLKEFWANIMIANRRNWCKITTAKPLFFTLHCFLWKRFIMKVLHYESTSLWKYFIIKVIQYEGNSI